MDGERTFSLGEVVSKGFEARCEGADGALYFWHRSFGVRIERRTSTMTLLTDPAVLPDAAWIATKLGVKELEVQASTSV